MQHRAPGVAMFLRRNRRENVWFNTAAGALGGLLGAWTMNQFQTGLAKLQPSQQNSQKEGEPATVKAAEKVSETTTGHELTAEQKKTAEPVVHYGFGTLVGAI